MRNVRRLLYHMVKQNHPGGPIVEAVLECSDCPDFTASVCRLLADAVEKDQAAQKDWEEKVMQALRAEQSEQS